MLDWNVCYARNVTCQHVVSAEQRILDTHFFSETALFAMLCRLKQRSNGNAHGPSNSSSSSSSNLCSTVYNSIVQYLVQHSVLRDVYTCDIHHIMYCSFASWRHILKVVLFQLACKHAMQNIYSMHASRLRAETCMSLKHV